MMNAASGSGSVLTAGDAVRDDILMDMLILKLDRDGLPALPRLVGALLRRMRDEMQEGDPLPTNRALVSQGTSMTVATSARQILAALGFAEKIGGGSRAIFVKARRT
jgi:hypothetical protein